MALRRSSARMMGQVLSAAEANAPAVARTEASAMADASGVRQASLQDVKLRMTAVNNIRKITSAMKMVAAAKMRRAEAAAMASRGFTDPMIKLFGDSPMITAEKHVTVPVSTDKGLCGGLNSSLTKYVRITDAILKDQPTPGEHGLVILGDKCRTQLARDYGDVISSVVNDYSKTGTSFGTTSAIAEEIMAAEPDVVRIVYNRFKSAIAFKPTFATVLMESAAAESEEITDALRNYDIEEGADMASLAEFNLASTLHGAILENTCSEHASRMSAMENSTKNAGDMLNSLTLLYNRSRQAAITTELIEIISGASALED